MDSRAKLFVCRATHENGIVPGKLHVGHKSAYIAFGGKEHAKSSYAVLVAPTASLSWVDASGGTVHPQAIPGGN
jgi:hypothetical protein